jgi:hypothetical protein
MAAERVYWRTGLKARRALYKYREGEEDGELIGVMHTPELADQVVAAVNSLLEKEFEDKGLPEHVHIVNKYSTMKFDGVKPVWLCGYAEGECSVIVCDAYQLHDGTWTRGRPYL